MEGNLLVIALGGNAIKQAEEKGITEEQFRNVDVTARQIARIAREGYRLVLTHGNGPQAGALLIQQEEGEKTGIPAQSLAACGAMTQGQIGWMIQNRLAFWLRQEGIHSPVCTVVTQVVVSEQDPDFQDPSKPVGPFYTRKEACRLEAEKQYAVKEVKPTASRGWRRVVPSPEPQDIVEKDAINALLASGAIVLASGGGGIPVRRNGDGSYSGVEAVIDKDRAGFVLAQAVSAQGFLILTDVEKVFLRYGRPDASPLDRLTVAQARDYLARGHFLAGSMGPKIEAALRFAWWSRREAIITSLDKALEAILGRTGTRIGP
jgi:carbamate kinase